MEGTQFFCDAPHALHTYTLGEAEVVDAMPSAADAIEVLAEAAGATLTPEELAQLKQEREANPEICPRCHVGYAGGMGWNLHKDRCGACGYAGKRRPVPAKKESA